MERVFCYQSGIGGISAHFTGQGLLYGSQISQGGLAGGLSSGHSGREQVYQMGMPVVRVDNRQVGFGPRQAPVRPGNQGADIPVYIDHQRPNLSRRVMLEVFVGFSGSQRADAQAVIQSFRAVRSARNVCEKGLESLCTRRCFRTGRSFGPRFGRHNLR